MRFLCFFFVHPPIFSPLYLVLFINFLPDKFCSLRIRKPEIKTLMTQRYMIYWPILLPILRQQFNMFFSSSQLSEFIFRRYSKRTHMLTDVSKNLGDMQSDETISGTMSVLPNLDRNRIIRPCENMIS